MFVHSNNPKIEQLFKRNRQLFNNTKSDDLFYIQKVYLFAP